MSVSLANGVSVLYTKELIAGTGITFTTTPTSITIDSSGTGSGQAGIQFQDEGSNLGTSGTVTTVNFTGTGVTASRASNTITVDITGGGGGTTWGSITGTLSSQTDLNTALNDRVLSTRQINTTAPLTGGGDLSANRTLAVNTFGAAQAGVVPSSGGGTANYLRADGSWTAPVGTTNLGYTASTRILTSDTGTDVTLPIFTGTEAGLTPLSGGGTANYLRADGTWASPPGGVGTTNLTWTASTRTVASDTGTDAVITLVTSADAGLAPASGGGSTNFLRADGTWNVPPGNPTDLSYTASTRLLASSTGADVNLPLFNSTDAGLTPLSGGGTTNFLRADGTWAAPPGGAGTNLTYTASTRLLESSTGTDVTLPLFTSTDAGLTPLSGGGTSNFLRADGTWAAPAGGTGTDLSYTASTRLLASSTGADVTLPLFTSTEAGLTPLSGGGTTNFLRADGTWSAPAGGGGGLTYGRAYALARGYALP